MEPSGPSESGAERLSRLKELVGGAAFAAQKGDLDSALTMLEIAARAAVTDDERDQLFWQLNELARMLASHQDFNAARQVLLAVLRHADTTNGDRSVVGAVLLNLARISRALGLFDEAELYLDRAALSGDDPEREFAVLGERVSLEGQTSTGCDVWRRVWAGRTAHGPHLLFPLVLARYSGLVDAGKVSAAAELLHEVKTFEWEEDYRCHLADMFAAVAEASAKENNSPASRELWDEALSILPPACLVEGRRSYVSAAARMHRTTGDGEGALRLYERALSLFHENETEDRAECFGNVGITCMGLGRYEDAESSLRFAVKTARHAGHKGVLAVSLDNLAMVLWTRRRSVSQSIDFLTEATNIHSLLGDTLQAGNCWLNLFRVCRDGDSPQPLEVGAKALALLRKVGPPDSEALCLRMLVEVSIERGSEMRDAYLSQLAAVPAELATAMEVSVLQARGALEAGDYHRCIRILASAAGHAGVLAEWDSVIKSLQYAGAALVSLRAHTAARRLYGTMLELGIDEPNPVRYGGFRAATQLLASIGLGVVEMAEGALLAAKDRLLRAAEMVENQHGNMLRMRMAPNALRNYADALVQAAAGLEDLGFIGGSPDRDLMKLLCIHPGFYISDFSDSAKFSTQNGLDFTEHAPKDSEKESQIFAVFDNRYFSEVYRLAIEKVIWPAHEVADGFRLIENSRSRFYTEDVRNRDALSQIRHIPMSGGTFNPLTYVQMTQWLQSHQDTAVINFFVGQTTGLAWVGFASDAVTMRVVQLPRVTEGALRAIAEAYGLVSLESTLFGGRSVSQSIKMVAELVSRLYETVFADAQMDGACLVEYLQRAGIKRLVLVPYGYLHFLPLHAARDTSGVYLCDRFEICYSPSAWFVHRNLALPRTIGERILVVANPDGTLEQTEAELRALYPLFSEGALLGPGEASVEAVMRALARAEAMHFSCHGSFTPGDMDQTGLWLSNEELLSVRILMPDGKNFHMKPYAPHLRLAFLAACETGLDRWKPFEEPLSLAICFMGTGATSVISTLWRVPDSAATRLIPAFYTNLRKLGSPMGVALRNAIKTVRGDWPEPWYWAAYTLSGSWL